MWRRTRPFDMASALEVFSLALNENGKVFIVPMESGCITGSQPTCAFDEACRCCSVLVIPGFSSFEIGTVPQAREQEITFLQHAHSQGTTLVSLCTGAFWLASCGMLDGRIATTHWQQENIWTSAGASAGTDACLSITRQLLGDAIAESVSKQMAVTLERSGSHIQIADATSSSQHRFDSDLDHLRMLFLAHPEHPWKAGDLAAALGMSVRTLERKFKEWGTTPHQWILRERLLMAQSLLISTTMRIDSIAHAVGFSDTDLMRRHFLRLFCMTPRQFQLRNERSRLADSLGNPPNGTLRQ